MAKFIALEGLHGVGKSTVANLVAEQLGAELVPTVPDKFRVAREFVNSCHSIESRYMLFLSAALSAGEQIESYVSAGIDVVTESYIYRTIAFHEGMGSLITVNLSQQLFLPTHTVLLTCEPQVRTERMEHRGGLRGKWDAFAESRWNHIAARYNSFQFPAIDTTLLNPEQVANKVMEVVNADT